VEASNGRKTSKEENSSASLEIFILADKDPEILGYHQYEIKMHALNSDV